MPDGMTVSEFLAFWRPFYSTWDLARERERELLDLFRLPMERKLKHLSRGMRMKAALVSSLAYRPELIVLDEPFSGLDPLVRDEFIEGLLAHAEESTILISSHDLAEIESFASHVGFLDEWRMQFSEEMAVLAERFREVEVTVDIASLPSGLPASWVRTVRSRTSPRPSGSATPSSPGRARCARPARSRRSPPACSRTRHRRARPSSRTRSTTATRVAPRRAGRSRCGPGRSTAPSRPTPRSPSPAQRRSRPAKRGGTRGWRPGRQRR